MKNVRIVWPLQGHNFGQKAEFRQSLVIVLRLLPQYPFLPRNCALSLGHFYSDGFWQANKHLSHIVVRL